MDFFKSVFSDDPPEPSDADENLDGVSDDGDSAAQDPIPENSWSFGGLMKTLTTKSETVIQTYRKDLQEFGSGLKMETAVIRDVASRAVADLPASLEIGAAVAQESLESVGQVIDDIGTSVWKSTAEIVAHGKDSILVADDGGGDDGDNDSDRTGSVFANSSLSMDSKPYNRFESQLRAIQSSASTYLDEPEDSGTYEQWKLGFVLEDRSEEIEGLIKENRDIGEIYQNFVPGKVNRESFWLRYFFKVHRLKEVEEARVKLVKRAISGEEEEMTWDFEDDEEEDDDKDNKDGSEIKEVDEQEKIGESSSSVGVSDDAAEKLEALKLYEKVGSEEKGKASSDSGKESDVSIVSRPEEEDFKWDEMEDVGSSDEGKEEVGPVGASSRADPIKRLSNAVDEDLSWDIEDEDDDDDDEPKKS